MLSIFKTEYMECDFNAIMQEQGMLYSWSGGTQERQILLLWIDAPEGWEYQ
jgi:hypothetical protein